MTCEECFCSAAKKTNGKNVAIFHACKLYLLSIQWSIIILDKPLTWSFIENKSANVNCTLKLKKQRFNPFNGQFLWTVKSIINWIIWMNMKEKANALKTTETMKKKNGMTKGKQNLFNVKECQLTKHAFAGNFRPWQKGAKKWSTKKPKEWKKSRLTFYTLSWPNR